MAIRFGPASSKKRYVLHHAFYILTQAWSRRWLSERRLERMKKLLEAEDAKSFDELIRKLMDKSLRVPSSMFGVDRNRRVKLSLREHEEITRDAH